MTRNGRAVTRPLPCAEVGLSSYTSPKYTIHRTARLHRRDAKKRGATLGRPFTLADVKTRDGNACYLCGTIPDSPQLDHIIPIALGGTHSLDNTAIACPPCNNRKSANIIAFSTTTRRPHYPAG